MKLGQKNKNPNQAHRSDALAVIPLIPQESSEDEPKKKEPNQYKMWSDPADPDNTTEYTAGQFVSRLKTINRYFKFFPGTVRLFPEDEVDLIHAGLPNAWQTELLRVNFDFDNRTTAHLRDKVETIETCEHITGNSPHQKSQGHEGRQEQSDSFNVNAARTQRGSRGNKRRHHNGKSNGERIPCMLHGTTDHTTEECKVLKSQTKRMHLSGDTCRSNGRSSGSNRRNGHNRNRQSGARDDEELNVMRTKVDK
jgi:hypothetical protein